VKAMGPDFRRQRQALEPVMGRGPTIDPPSQGRKHFGLSAPVKVDKALVWRKRRQVSGQVPNVTRDAAAGVVGQTHVKADGGRGVGEHWRIIPRAFATCMVIMEKYPKTQCQALSEA